MNILLLPQLNLVTLPLTIMNLKLNIFTPFYVFVTFNFG